MGKAIKNIMQEVAPWNRRMQERSLEQRGQQEDEKAARTRPQKGQKGGARDTKNRPSQKVRKDNEENKEEDYISNSENKDKKRGRREKADELDKEKKEDRGEQRSQRDEARTEGGHEREKAEAKAKSRSLLTHDLSPKEGGDRDMESPEEKRRRNAEATGGQDQLDRETRGESPDSVKP